MSGSVLFPFGWGLTRWRDTEYGVSFDIEDDRHFVDLMAVRVFVFIIRCNE